LEEREFVQYGKKKVESSKESGIKGYKDESVWTFHKNH
jgi:hypothetical protein